MRPTNTAVGKADLVQMPMEGETRKGTKFQTMAMLRGKNQLSKTLLSNNCRVWKSSIVKRTYETTSK